MTDEITSRPPLDTDVAPGPSAMSVLLVAAGGTVGTALRHLVGEAIPPVQGVPAGTFVVNLTGAALLGYLVGVLARPGGDTGRRHHARLALGTGLLGGYTTYSALATGTAELMLDGRPGAGLVHALATVLLGAVATWAGIVLAGATGRQG